MWSGSTFITWVNSRREISFMRKKTAGLAFGGKLGRGGRRI